MDDLIRQEDLQKEAHEVLDKLDLLNILSRYGPPQIVGSLATGLMTWKDIDIEIVGPIDEEKYWKVVKKIFHTPGYKRTFVIDFRKSVNPNTPKGLHICITDYSLREGEDPWKMDIWFVDRNEGEITFHDWIKDKISDENKPYLLSLKKEARKYPNYGKDIFSIDVYKAVIEHNAKNIEDFKKYLRLTNRSLNEHETPHTH
ncbi:MAG TPA: hypothetical protein VG917_01115 [Patescibacteria group bacterium]|nr:hypothetical protein [Patescibacteria group bacterium]